jgi:hypothetical protein
LSDFILEPKKLSLKFTVPVLPAMASDDGESDIPPGLWLQAKTVMKLKVDLARPFMSDRDLYAFLEQNREDLLQLQQESERDLKKTSDKLVNARQFITGPYSRVIVIIPYATNSCNFYFRRVAVNALKEVFAEIDRQNMAVLGFDANDSLQRSLFEHYKLSPEQRTTVIVCTNLN